MPRMISVGSFPQLFAVSSFDVGFAGLDLAAAPVRATGQKILASDRSDVISAGIGSRGVAGIGREPRASVVACDRFVDGWPVH